MDSTFVLFAIVLKTLRRASDYFCSLHSLDCFLLKVINMKTGCRRTPSLFRLHNEAVLSQEPLRNRLGANSLFSELFINFSSFFGRTEMVYWLWFLGSGTGIWHRCRM